MASRFESSVIAHLMCAMWSLMIYGMTCPSALLFISDFFGFSKMSDSPWYCPTEDEAKRKSRMWHRFAVPLGFAFPTLVYIMPPLNIFVALCVYLLATVLIGWQHRRIDGKSRSSS